MRSKITTPGLDGARWRARLATGVLGGLFLVSGCAANSFSARVQAASDASLREGLPRKGSERELVAGEVGANATSERHGYDFYDLPLPLTPEDTSALRTILGDRASYERHKAGKKCGGFHPDYALEWHVEGQLGPTVEALVCFSCDEVMLFGPGIKGHYDLSEASADALTGLLAGRSKDPSVQGSER